MEITNDMLLLLENSNPGAFTINKLTENGMKMLFASPEAGEVVGMSKEELLDISGNNTLFTVLEQDRHIIEAEMKKCIGGRGDMDAEYHVLHKTKGYIPIRAKGRIIGTMNGVPIVYASFYSTPDAEALREKSRELQNLVDNIPTAIFICRKKSGILNIIYTNDYYRSLSFADKEKITSLDENGLLERIHPNDRAEAKRFFNCLFDEKKVCETSYRSLYGDVKTYRWYHISGKPVPKPDGSVLAYAAITDITTEKQAVENALKSQQMYRLVTSQAKQLIFEYDQKNKLVFYKFDNPYTRAVCEMQGIPQVMENVPDSLIEMVDEPYRKAFLSMFEPVEKDTGARSAEYSSTVNGKTFWWRVTSTPVIDSAGNVITVYCSAQDITEMKTEQQSYIEFLQNLDRAYPNNLGSFRINLTKNICVDGKSPFDFVLEQKKSGTVDGYFEEFSKLINDKEQLDWFKANITREKLIKGYNNGKKNIVFEYSYRYPDGLRHRQGIIIMHQNPRTADIEGVTYAVDIDAQKRGEMIRNVIAGDERDYTGFIDIISGVFIMNSGKKLFNGIEAGGRIKYNEFISELCGYCDNDEGKAAVSELAALDKLTEVLDRKKEYTVLYDFAAADNINLKPKKQIVLKWLDRKNKEIIVTQTDITDAWKEGQERFIREKEAAVLKDTVLNVTVGIMIISKKDGITELIAGNDSIYNLLGDDCTKISDFINHTHKDDIAKIKEALDNCYNSKATITADFRFYPNNKNEMKYYHIVAKAVGKKIEERLVYCCLLDVTKEKTAETARAEAQRAEMRKYETQLKMMASANEGFAASYHINISKNLCTNMVVESDVYLSLKKLSASGTADGLFEETAKTIPNENIAENVRNKFNCRHLLQLFAQGETKLTMEYPCYSARGGVRWICGTVNMVKNPETNDIEGITYAIDIDEQKKLELVTNRVVELGFEYIGILYFNTDEIEFIKKKPHIIYPEIGQKVKYSVRRHFVQENFVNKRELENYTAATDPELIKNELEKNEEYTFSYLQTDAEGQIICRQLQYSRLDAEHNIALVVQNDATAAYEHEEKQLAVIQGALLEAEKACSAKTDFVSRISHDIRTPIGAITNITAFALEDINQPQKLKDDLQKIQASTEFLLSLVNDVLDISKIDSGKIELHNDIVTAVEFNSNIMNMFEPLCENKNIKFSIDNNTDVKAIRTDRVRLNQIAMNLISNAVKYTNDGGEIKVSLKAERAGGGMCRCAIEVTDNGIGMSKDFQSRMFEPFTQEENNPLRDKTSRGSGLGLSLVKKLTDLIGGTITVVSDIGMGTNISAEFTAAEADIDKIAAEKNDKKPQIQLSGRILLAEDNEINKQIAKRVLGAMGFEITCVSNGKEAIEAFAENSAGTFKAILMDIQMPIMNGYEAAKGIRKLERGDAKEIPIIAMTADAFTAAMEHSKSVGMTDFVTKPLDISLLRQTLEKYGGCGGGDAPAGNVTPK